MLAAGLASAQTPPAAAPPPSAPADTRWTPPPPLPSSAAPAYRPLQPADAPTRRPAEATRPVLTFQKPAGGDTPKPADAGKPPEKVDRDPPKAVENPATGRTDPFKLFRLEGDTDLLKRVTDELRGEEEGRTRKSPPALPEDPRPLPVDATYFRAPTVDSLVAPGVRYQAKTASYPPAQMAIEPGYVVHRRLYFEELNSERHGWEVGFAQPAVSTLLFWKDAMLFPAKLASNLGEWYDTSAGKCVPGSPVPYKLYPEPVDGFGLLVGSLAIVGTTAALSGGF